MPAGASATTACAVSGGAAVLSLDALVHGALIDYPRYVSRHSGLFIEPEQAIEELLAWRSAPPVPLSLRQRIFRHWGRLRRR
jgi:capsular polysaccharide export protein